MGFYSHQPVRQRRPRYLIFAAAAAFCFLFYLHSHTGSNAGRIQASFPSESKNARVVRLERREQVKGAFQHSWKAYREKAWLHDELMPLTGGVKDPFVGWAATLVDSLDALWIMGLKDEFEEAVAALEQIDFSKPHVREVPVFEVTIRYLGGLLGAWDISEHQYPILLVKAEQLGNFLYGAFNTNNGLPIPYWAWNTDSSDKMSGGNGVAVAQIGTLSLEFIRLSQVTGDMKYADVIQTITNQLEQTQNTTAIPGMWPAMADCSGESLRFPSGYFTLGALADSLYEYLPKTHLIVPQSSSFGQQYLRMYHTALASISNHLFFRPSLPGTPDILFPGEASMKEGGIEYNPRIQHLACFMGATVGLGAKINRSPTELETARKLTDGCVWAYENTPSGIMPEIFHAKRCANETSCTWQGAGAGYSRIDDRTYRLRPEAIESVFVMYRLDADPEWQEKGWRMFEAIEKHARTDLAYAEVKNVMDDNSGKEDTMESFWLAETLKYFYLLFSEPDLVDLDEYVLNTEAHPLRIHKW